jgi:hypothetical protein
MVEQIGVSPPHLCSHCLQGDGLRPLFEQQETRCLQCGGTTLFGV